MLKLKIPPVAVTLIFATFMKLIDLWITIGEFHFRLQFELSVLLFIAAGAIGFAGVIEFIRQSTSVNPHKPKKAQKLVTSGLYHFSRNPMYLALLLALVSWGFHLSNFFTFLMIPIFIWYMNEFQIKPEEEVMREKFGKEFQEYSQAVRRWV